MSATQHAQFPATRWTLVVKAAHTPTPEASAALEELCSLYWPPLYTFLRRSGSQPHEAKDIVQGYLARVLERNDLLSVSPQRGRFRTYLLAGLRHFLTSEYRREMAQKRGGGAVISIETAEVEQNALADLCTLTPDAAYDRNWAEMILRKAVSTLQREYSARARETLYDTLKPALTGGKPEDHATWGRQLGMTPGAVAVAIHRLRLRLRELVRHEVAQTVHDPADVDDELRNLKAILSS